MSILKISDSIKKHQFNKGMTLIELVIVLAILSIIGAVIFFSFNTHKAKGQLLLVAEQGLASAAKRMDVETSCYPTNAAVLFNETDAAQTSYNTCGTDISNTWSGPYMQVRPVDTKLNLSLNQISPKVHAGFTQLQEAASNSFSETYQYAVVADNVPGSIARQFMVACSGNGTSTSASSMCVSGSGAAISNSGMSLTNQSSAPSAFTTTNDVAYVFAQSNEPYIDDAATN